MKIKFFDKSILKFLLVGVGNTILSAVLMFVFEDLGYWISTAVAYIAGAVMSFFLNRYFTFKSEEKLLNSAIKFAFSVAVCYVLAYSLAQPLVSLVLSKTVVPNVWQERTAKLFGMGLYTVINYFAQRFFAFKRISK